MAHINLVGDCEEMVTKDVEILLEAQNTKSVVGDSTIGGDVISGGPLVGVIMGSDSDLPTMSPAIEILKQVSERSERALVTKECEAIYNPLLIHSCSRALFII